MKSQVFTVLGLLLGALSLGQVAMADSTRARCDIYPAGSDHASGSLLCTFSQRQGYITIDRADGVYHDLSPVEDAGPGNFVDTGGNRVYRQSGLGDKGLIFRFPRESVYVWWDVTKLLQDEAGAGMELTGMFRYMADAARFRDCRNGLSFPVAMEGAYIDLERAYTAEPHEAGAELMVRLRGRYLERSSMEGDRSQVHLVVDRFEGFETGVCEPSAHASLTGTWWRLAVIGDRRVTVAEDQSEPHMVLEGATGRVRGNGGCNNFLGSYETRDNSIRFSAMGSTMMACPAGEETERVFLGVLPQAERYQISGEVLELFAGDQSLARFESVYH